jgi:hypothetical protein
VLVTTISATMDEDLVAMKDPLGPEVIDPP